MTTQEEGSSSSRRAADRQALTCIGIGGLAGCLLFTLFGVLVWSLAPQISTLFTELVAGLDLPTIAGPTNVLYVRSDGSGLVCDSWQNACELQTALRKAQPGDEIWVQAGLYKPAADTRDLEASFMLREGVEVYGGFAGTETARDQRDWETHLTVLSGDLGGDDKTDPDGVVTATVDILGQNAYHVVGSKGVSSAAVLDGFVITAGFANLTPPNIHGFGGGMFNWTASPTLNNLVFSGNTAGKGAPYYGGGGMFNMQSSAPALTNVTFVANTAGGGGGMYNDASSPTLNGVIFDRNRAIDNGGMVNYKGSNPTLTDVTFSGNVASRNGGGMVNSIDSNPSLTRVTFVDNSAGDYGGGMGNFQSSPALTDVEFSDNRAGREGGGMYNGDHSNPVLMDVAFADNSAANSGGGMLNTESSPTLTNVSFSGNSAGEYGGGICNTFSSGPTLANVTFYGNRAPHGSAICNVGGSFELVNGIVWGNSPAGEQVYNDNVTPRITFSDVEGGFPGAGNLNADPRLGDFDDSDGPTGTFPLRPGSPVIDMGSPEACPATDQLGLPRPVDGNHDGAAVCDMGAFEYRE